MGYLLGKGYSSSELEAFIDGCEDGIARSSNSYRNKDVPPLPNAQSTSAIAKRIGDDIAYSYLKALDGAINSF